MLVRKKIGEKHYYQGLNNFVIKKVISEQSYTTNGEYLLIIKDVDYCELTLNNESTDFIKIKSMTKVLIKSDAFLIDLTYNELLLEKGSCVELEFVEDGWYITSSDGLKLV